MNRRALWMGLLSFFILPGRAIGEASDVSARVKKIVAEHLNVEPDKVTDNANFIDLGADSLDTVELVMAFEEEFGCEIPDSAAETICTVGDAIKFLAACKPQPRKQQSIHRKRK